MVFCSAVCTFYTLGIFIVVVTAIVFVSKVIYEGNLEKNPKFYEIGFKSYSLYACLSSIFFSLIVEGMAFFSLSFSSSTTYQPKSSNMPKSELIKKIQRDSDKESSALYNIPKKVLENTRQSILPPTPPPPPPPLSHAFKKEKRSLFNLCKKC